MVGDIEFVYGIQKAMKAQIANNTTPLYAYKMALDGPLNYFKRFCQVKFFKTLVVILLFAKTSGNNSVKSLCETICNKLPRNPVEGVAHADDLFYLFTTFFVPKLVKGSIEDLYVQRFVKLWTNFAKFGNPTPEIDETLNGLQWKPVSKNTDISYCVIDKKLEMKENIEKERIDFWDKVYAEYKP